MNTRGYLKNNMNPIYLSAPIIEAILLSCINDSSFYKINLNVQRVTPTSKSTLRKYIFDLINNAFISYNGGKKKYIINSSGLRLLDKIYSYQSNGSGYTDLLIRIN